MVAALLFILLGIPNLPWGEFQDSFREEVILEPGREVTQVTEVS